MELCYNCPLLADMLPYMLGNRITTAYFLHIEMKKGNFMRRIVRFEEWLANNELDQWKRLRMEVRGKTVGVVG
jgi:hypothetical protein